MPDYLHHLEALCALAHRRTEFSPHTGHFPYEPSVEIPTRGPPPEERDAQ